MDYYLAPNVHACGSGDLIIFLDLERDRYFAAPRYALELDVPCRRIRAYAERGGGWDARILAQGLVRQRAHASPLHTRPRARAGLWPRGPAFVAALMWARFALDRPLALCAALAELRARRTHAPDSASARREADVFASWRPLWPRRYVCLHDTLALAWFLSARGTGCEVVFGVQARPFAAHCWAEIEGAVLNDEAEYCASFDVIVRT
jgi:hypothetical protein